MTQTSRFSPDPNADPNAEMCGKGWMKTSGGIKRGNKIFVGDAIFSPPTFSPCWDSLPPRFNGAVYIPAMKADPPRKYFFVL